MHWYDSRRSFHGSGAQILFMNLNIQKKQNQKPKIRQNLVPGENQLFNFVLQAYAAICLSPTSCY